jgi:hypothetical protein
MVLLFIAGCIFVLLPIIIWISQCSPFLSVCMYKGFAYVLCSIIQDSTLSLTIRHLAAIIMDIVIIKKHWDVGESDSLDAAGEAETDASNIHISVSYYLSDEEKSSIKTTLPSSLGDPTKKIRNAVANIIAKVSSRDYPDRWPSFLESLVSSLRTTNKDLLHGSLKCLSLVLDDLDADYVSSLAPSLLPELLYICTHCTSDLESKLRVIIVLSDVYKVLGMVSGFESAGISAIVRPTLPEALKILAGILSEIPTSTLHCGLQTNALKIVFNLIQFFPKLLEEHMKLIVEVILSLMKGVFAIYVKELVYDNGSSHDDGYDSDGDSYGFKSEVIEIFELFRILVQSPRKLVRQAITSKLDELCYFTTGYLQMTADQIETWESDPDAYIIEEDDDSMASGVRNTGKELLDEIARSYRQNGAGATAVYGAYICIIYIDIYIYT